MTELTIREIMVLMMKMEMWFRMLMRSCRCKQNHGGEGGGGGNADGYNGNGVNMVAMLMIVRVVKVIKMM